MPATSFGRSASLGGNSEFGFASEGRGPLALAARVACHAGRGRRSRRDTNREYGSEGCADCSRVRHRPIFGASRTTSMRSKTSLFRAAMREIKARLYRTDATANTILFFHGGGWVLGSIETHDGAVRALVNAARANVLSIEYRKAPENPFPAAIEDAEAALDWLISNASAKGLADSRLIVAGDSAGATISAVLAIRARDRNLPLLGQSARSIRLPISESQTEPPAIFRRFLSRRRDNGLVCQPLSFWGHAILPTRTSRRCLQKTSRG